MIRLNFDNFKLTVHTVDIHQYDNGTVPVVIIGEFPEQYTSWDLLVGYKEDLNIIHLTQMDDASGYTHIFTSDELAYAGDYIFQIAGNFGENVRHSSKVKLFIPSSLNGDAQWPELPTAFSEAVEKVEAAVEHYPHIGENGNWFVWDVENEVWVDTHISASGGESFGNTKGHHKKIGEYLYESSYHNIDYDYAYEYFISHNDTANIGACSSVRNGMWYGRNLDWVYDDRAQFIVNVYGVEGKYSSIGVSGAITGLTPEIIDNDEAGDLTKIVPFCLQDGINEYGLVVNTNVVPKDHGENVSEPTIETRDSVNGIMLCRYILDNFKTAEEAVNYIDNYVSVWFSSLLHDMNYEQHYMIADKEHTYILEFIENKAVIIDASDYPYMTNFYMDGITLNQDGSVYTPATLSSGDPVQDNGITEHGSGLERFNFIVNNYSSCATKDGMLDTMKGLNYTKAYNTSVHVSDPYWYTEFVGDELHCNSPIEDFSNVCNEAGFKYLSRTRHDPVEDATWQTAHTSVYNIESRELYIINQEEELIYHIDFNPIYTELFERLKEKQDIITDIDTIRAGAALGATAIQEHQSLEGYATEDWVSDQGYLTEHQSLEAYRTSEEQDVIDATKADIDDVVTDVQINGASIVTDGVAEIPIAGESQLGAVGVKGTGYSPGIMIDNDGYLRLYSASDAQISSRTAAVYGFNTSQIDKIVKTALTDGRGAAYTDAEKLAARTRIGVDALESDLEDTNRSLKFLWELNKGQTWDFDTDTDTTYAKTVPSGAKFAAVDSIGGRSAVANQLAPVISFTADVDQVRSKSFALEEGTRIIAGNKYLLIYTASDKETDKNVGFYVPCRYENTNKYAFSSIAVENGIKKTIATALYSGVSLGNITTTEGNVWLYIAAEDSAGNKCTVSNVRLVDLTQWFGSGNEPSSVDDPRMDEVYAYLEEHPEYNAGEIMSAEVDEVEVEGKNLYADGDQSFTQLKSVELSNTIKPGTYTVSVEVESTDTDGDASAMVFLDRSGNTLTSAPIYRNSRWNFTKTFREEVAKIDLYSGGGFPSSAGDNATFSKIQIEAGSTATPYSPYSISAEEIPSAIRALPGYGESNETDVNTIDYAEKVYHKKGSYVSGEWVADAEDIDISSLLPDGFLTNLPVEAGGTITYKQANDTELAVPVQNIFLVKLSEVN